MPYALAARKCSLWMTARLKNMKKKSKTKRGLMSSVISLKYSATAKIVNQIKNRIIQEYIGNETASVELISFMGA